MPSVGWFLGNFSTMKRPRACDDKVDFIRSEKSPPSDVEVENFFTSKYAPLISTVKMPPKELSSEGTPMSSAKVTVIIYLQR
ncbi:hypothetical protein SAY87_007934 [Trapa incisa]|uniref:Uncharacterized protein n=1 Tax=Trapa incisa TaxID=236973 RepID=A0AAN7QFI3_9MYRT|nr:hypothetical protein SAY87_007934 [Trapa incisa]